MEASLVVSAAAAVVAIIFGLAAHFRTKSFTELSERVAKVEARMETYFDSQEKYNALILHRDDDEHEVDELLDKKMIGEELQPDESELLVRKLEEIVYDRSNGIGMRTAAAQLLAVKAARDVGCE